MCVLVPVCEGCVCVCVPVCVCVHVPMCEGACMCVHVETRGQPHLRSCPPFLRGLILGPGACQFDSAVWPASPRHPLVSTSSVLGLYTPLCLAFLNVRFGALN